MRASLRSCPVLALGRAAQTSEVGEGVRGVPVGAAGHDGAAVPAHVHVQRVRANAAPPEQQVPHLPHGGGVAAGNQGGDQGGGRRERVARSGDPPVVLCECHECALLLLVFESRAPPAANRARVFSAQGSSSQIWAQTKGYPD